MQRYLINEVLICTVTKMDIVDVLRDMAMVPGVSGFEEPFRRYLLEKLKAHNPFVDDIGNVYVKIGKGSKKIAFMAHMDEIGLVITHIEDNGYLRFAHLGGIDDRMLYGRIVEIFTPSGIVYGVIGLIPPHLSTNEDRSKIPTWKDLVIDVGAQSKEEVLNMGIREMQPARWKKDFIETNNYVITRAIDDRVGCAILFEVLNEIANEELNSEIYFIWTVQEETGLRGAHAAIENMKFDEVYAIDTMTTGMMPGVAFHLSTAKIGSGPAIRLVDRKGVASQRLREKVKKIAEENGIPIQEAITGGTTDSAIVQDHGVNSIALCVPVKYTHSPVEMANIDDIKNTVKLIKSIINS